MTLEKFISTNFVSSLITNYQLVANSTLLQEEIEFYSEIEDGINIHLENGTIVTILFSIFNTTAIIV